MIHSEGSFCKSHYGLTDEDIRDFKEAFRILDMDGSGKIDAKELGNILQKFGHNPS